MWWQMENVLFVVCEMNDVLVVVWVHVLHRVELQGKNPFWLLDCVCV